MFKGYQIAKEEPFLEHLNQYDVIYLNMQQFLLRAKDQEVTKYLERAVIEELGELYNNLFSGQVTILAEALERIYAKTDKEFIFLIDEWDCVMLNGRSRKKCRNSTLISCEIS